MPLVHQVQVWLTFLERIFSDAYDESDREIGNLMEIRDFHHKYVVTTNRDDVQTIEGIQVIHIVDFLLQEKW